MKLFNRKKQATNLNPRRQILSRNSSFVAKEAYKTLRTNLRFFIQSKGCKKISITSANAGEGKSITLMNLAISMAETEQRVLLIDADMRRPALSRLLMEKANPGLSEVLGGIVYSHEAIRKDVYPNLDILFSGETPPNPSELLGSQRMRDLLDKASREYDYVLIDAPPVAIVSDVCVLADMIDGVLFLVRTDRTEKDAVQRGLKQLEISGAKLMGFVLNGGSKERGGYYGKKYKYKNKYGYYRYAYENAGRKQTGEEI